ncbi:O-antigen ligase family protein [Streptomyces sp. NBC_01142]|uniref:O-antigen ligase family protein n=1 Tax=Streptomyces sp. NBC_01142 TaxID=2975865 RepID=UPI0022529E3F|nr:O-antigen ligase family protein [Streptomyces sp. NBC_01142]MCX4825145.1 O-antigen ligase family protein [Streptomyces sp. NBC_01142]
MAAPDGRSAARERGRAPDVIGVVVLSACAVWSLISAAGREARPEGVLLAVFAIAAGYACGRICGTLLPVATASAAALAALGLAIASRQGMPGATAGTATQPGHTGAAAALLVLSAGAACCAASAARPLPLRLALRLLALAVACTALALGSVAGFAAALGVLLCSLAAVRMRRPALGLAGLALATALVVTASWGVAEDALPEGLTASLEGQLTHNRVALWQDALALAEDDPLRGAGPGRFGELSATAQQSLGSDGKPHSATLQQAAEQGVVGVALLGAAFGWLLYGLGRSPRSSPVVLSAGAALTALAVLASVGNALSFTPVTAGAGLLAGLATARAAGEGSMGLRAHAPRHTDADEGAAADSRMV